MFFQEVKTSSRVLYQAPWGGPAALKEAGRGGLDQLAITSALPPATQGRAFFRFPRDLARYQKWVENCRRADLENKTPNQINKHYRLCAKHFETSMICKTSPYRTVLRDNAIPTIFDLTSHLNNPHSRHRKRIK